MTVEKIQQFRPKVYVNEPSSSLKRKHSSNDDKSTTKIMKYTPEEFEKIKKKLYKDHKALAKIPKLFLTETTPIPDMKKSPENRVSFPVVDEDKSMKITDVIKFNEKRRGICRFESESDDMYTIDVQSLISNVFLPKKQGHPLRWCKLLRPQHISKLLVVVVEGLGYDDYQRHCDKIKELNMLSKRIVPTTEYKGSIIDELLFTHNLDNVTGQKRKNALKSHAKFKKKHSKSKSSADHSKKKNSKESSPAKTPSKLNNGNVNSDSDSPPTPPPPPPSIKSASIVIDFNQPILLKSAGDTEDASKIASRKRTFQPKAVEDVERAVRKPVSIGADLSTDRSKIPKPYRYSKKNPDKVRISRLDLLLSTKQMIADSYPLPYMKSSAFKDFVFSHQTYEPVTEESPMFALDCEMCMTTTHQLELTSISVVDENCKLIYNSYVKPKNRITNYLTRFSGITKEIMDSTTTTLSQVHKELRKLIPNNAIICGQSLGSDFKALRMFHPYVIDTSVIYNVKYNTMIKPSLKLLTKTFLGRDIQSNNFNGHSAVEDAATTLDLVKLKMHHGIEFGNVLFGFDLNSDVAIKKRKREGDQVEANSISKLVISSNQKYNKIKGDDPRDASQLNKSQRYIKYMSSSIKCLFTLMKGCEIDFSAAIIHPNEEVCKRFENRTNVHIAKNIKTNDDVQKKTKKYCKKPVGSNRYCNMIYSTIKAKKLNKASDEEKKEEITLIDDMVNNMMSKLTDNSMAIVLFSGGNKGYANKKDSGKGEPTTIQPSICLMKIISNYVRKVVMT